VWATFAVLPAGHGILRGAVTLLLAAIVNPILASIGATLTLRVTAMLVAPDAPVPLWLGLILAGVVSVLAWVALKPFRRVWALFTGNPLAKAGDEIRSDARSGRKLAGRALRFGATNKITAATAADAIGDDLEERQQQAPAAERFTRTAPQVNLDAPAASPSRTAPPVRRDVDGFAPGKPLPQAERGDRPTVLARQADVDDAGFPAHKPAPVVDVSHDTPPPKPFVKAAGGVMTDKSDPFWGDAVQVDASSAREVPRRTEPASAVDGAEAYVVYDYERGGLVVDEPAAVAADDA
jgi:hypothetical protein